MEIAILGLPQSGKSTLFEIMTGIASREKFGEPAVHGRARVPDARFDELVEIFNPKKISPATVPFMDVNATGEESWGNLRNLVGGADGLVHIVDCFSTSSPDETAARYRKVEDELILSDLAIVEQRLSRLAKIPKATLKPEEALHAVVLPRIKEALEAGKTARSLSLSADEYKSLKSFALWTMRPELVVLNISEGEHGITESFKKTVETDSPVIAIACQIEMEISHLAPGERGPFLKEMGIEEPAFERIIKTAFHLLDRICYFTVGEDEVKAWVIPANSPAPKAAAAIHKDFERGFIKAEVVSYDDFMAFGKSIASARSAGKLRLEGKEYIVQDGDIISFRFNV